MNHVGRHQKAGALADGIRTQVQGEDEVGLSEPGGEEIVQRRHEGVREKGDGTTMVLSFDRNGNRPRNGRSVQDVTDCGVDGSPSCTISDNRIFFARGPLDSFSSFSSSSSLRLRSISRRSASWRALRS